MSGKLTTPSLLDLMYDGFHALFMLKNGSGPQNDASFIDKLSRFLDDVGRLAKQQGTALEDIEAAKYAFCAAVDEIILRSPFGIRELWQRRPLQLILFGEQLAGDNFFKRLEALRAKGSAHVQTLEVFHMCLLLGFQGRYSLDGVEKLGYLTARLGAEITQMKGSSAAFAPHAGRPDQVVNRVHAELPLWQLCSVFALLALLGFFGMRTMLDKNTETMLNGYNNIVALAPPAANLTITLP